MPNIPKTYWPDNTIYFLTGSTFLHYPYFNDFNKKLIVLNQIKKFKEKLNIPKVIYSIAINHYHLKFYLEKGLNLAIVKQYMHGGTTFEYKRKFPNTMKYKDMWQSFKTLRITSGEMDWKVTGYIIGNLLKHKEVSKIEELEGNIFTSYDGFVKEWGKETAQDLIYSVIGVEEDSENFISFKSLSDLKVAKPSAKAG